jgi:hypothetical protein
MRDFMGYNPIHMDRNGLRIIEQALQKHFKNPGDIEFDFEESELESEDGSPERIKHIDLVTSHRTGRILRALRKEKLLHRSDVSYTGSLPQLELIDSRDGALTFDDVTEKN